MSARRNLLTSASEIAEPQPVHYTAEDREKRLRRLEAAAFLTEQGFPISKATLESMATNGGGPAYFKWGKYPIYKIGDLLDWAEQRLGNSRRSTSEAA